MEQFQDTTAAQMHDWLKEHFTDFPIVSQKTVFNFVHYVRDKHQLPVVKTERQFQSIEELPYGQQAQVDFGHSNMRTSTGKRVKVSFFTLVLSRSRYKYIWFTDKPFTSALAVEAHQLAFEYIDGIPDEVVYDQDKVFMISENNGDIILTSGFKAYMQTQSFKLHFCRKTDPQSKGKVENVVKYVKRNFLYNRTYYNVETLNDEAMGWLGRTANLHNTIPWTELSELLPAAKSSIGCGAKPWFDNAGKFACMFLKHYTGLSDKKLIQRINTDWAIQEFCGIRLGINEQIKDLDIIGRIRSQLSADLEKLPEAQKILAKEWFKYVEQETLQQVSGDASCYESYLRYPTDVKLLWECVEWLYEKQLFRICAELKVNRPRNKFKEQSGKQLAYSKKKRKKPSATKVRLRSLLYLVNKGKHQLEELLKEPQAMKLFSIKDLSTYLTVVKVLEQQQYMFDNNVRSVANRIVSIFKPYVRPIVRGKENKAVEFGMKVHKIQIAGISFVEYTDFNAYNESTRMASTLTLHGELTGVKCMRAAFDQLYATNANRKLLTRENILTNFSRKGKENTKKTEEEKKRERQIKQQLGKERATKLEGSFGNEKNHYGLRKIKARSAETEQVWMFFGIMTANAVKVMRLKSKRGAEILKQAC